MTASVTVVNYPIRVADVPEVWRGDALRIKFSLSDSDGNPVDLNTFGDTWASMFRSQATSSQHTDATVDTSHLADGYVIVSLTGDQTQALKQDQYGYDVQATGGPLSPITIWTGVVNVSGDFTRNT